MPFSIASLLEAALASELIYIYITTLLLSAILTIRPVRRWIFTLGNFIRELELIEIMTLITLVTPLALNLYMVAVLWNHEKTLTEIDQIDGFHKIVKVCEGLVDPSVKGSVGKIPCTLDYAQMQKLLEGSMGDFFVAEKGHHVDAEGKVLVEIGVFAMIKD
ncbi:hypothetical protein N7466_005611 [Penicillium verhagenii]|uniref:uncharacterized protein n=1 Tax=Penicillium verhagenii TaxID=1562060 RepID=UPI0025453FDD|nr:uncharacterized protein N7466_005611 [Penicillium verhagenii]KAJ5930118.1 hypothetical protein N7466_005611 [Penicillium verhagenii]